MSERQQYTVRANRGRPRIWIEGKRLVAAGFLRGRRYTQHNGDGVELVILPAGSDGGKVVSGKGGDELPLERHRPVIDLVGASCAPFETGDAVEIEYREGEIRIRRARV